MIDLESSINSVIDLTDSRSSSPTETKTRTIDLTLDNNQQIVSVYHDLLIDNGDNNNITIPQQQQKRMRKNEVLVETDAVISNNIAANYNKIVMDFINNKSFGNSDDLLIADVVDTQNLQQTEEILNCEVIGTYEMKVSPVKTFPGDHDFDPVICVIGDRSMLNGEAVLHHSDLMRLRSDPNLPSEAKLMNDNLLFFFDTFDFMKLSHKYASSIIFWSPYTYQVISSPPEHRSENYKVLLKGKSNKDIKNIFKTLAFCFDCYFQNHISAITIYFLKSLLVADYLDSEVFFIC